MLSLKYLCMFRGWLVADGRINSQGLSSISPRHYVPHPHKTPVASRIVAPDVHLLNISSLVAMKTYKWRSLSPNSSAGIGIIALVMWWRSVNTMMLKSGPWPGIGQAKSVEINCSKRRKPWVKSQQSDPSRLGRRGEILLLPARVKSMRDIADAFGAEGSARPISKTFVHPSPPQEFLDYPVVMNQRVSMNIFIMAPL